MANPLTTPPPPPPPPPHSSPPTPLSPTIDPPLATPEQNKEAALLYHKILHDCETARILLPHPRSEKHFERELEYDEDYLENPEDFPPRFPLLHKLFRCLYEYTPSANGRETVVRIVLHGLFPPPIDEGDQGRALLNILPRARCWRSYSLVEQNRVYESLKIFAVGFLEGFLVPLKGQGQCTPDVSTLLSATSWTEEGPQQGTGGRLRLLRQSCWKRDGYRCVITGMIDSSYATKQMQIARRSRLKVNLESGVKTEAAHIIPHNLNSHDSARNLSGSNHFVWRVMNMIDPGITDEVQGLLIDTPSNTMILSNELHDRFGQLECYLQAVRNAPPNTYSFHECPGVFPINPAYAPKSDQITFTNHEPSDSAKSDLPSPRLLRFHRACCLILYMSGAGDYVDRVLQDTERLLARGVLASDGSSDLALALALSGIYEGDLKEISGRWDLFWSSFLLC